MNKKIWLLLGFVTAFVLLAVAVLSGNVEGFNGVIINRIQSFENAPLTSVTVFISNMGEWFVYAPIAILLIIIPRSRMKIGIPAAAVLASSAALNQLLKISLHVDRPNIYPLITETGFGFPSGHSMNATAFVGICAYMFMRYTYKKTLKIASISFSVVFIALMGFSRIYLGVHNPTDVIGGYLCGLAVIAAAVLLLDNISRKKTG